MPRADGTVPLVAVPEVPWLQRFTPGERVRIVAGELEGVYGTVVTDWSKNGTLQVPLDRVWVVTEAGDNPLPFQPGELRRVS